MFILFLLFPSLISTTLSICPDGSVQYFNDKTHCIFFQSNKTYFINAEIDCMNLGGHLASIHDMLENMFLSQQALIRFAAASTINDFRIGINDLVISKHWYWMDGTLLDFKDWDKGQPQNVSGYDCGVMIMEGGKWKADDCYKQKPYVCLIQASDEIETTPAVTYTVNTSPEASTEIITTTESLYFNSCKENEYFRNGFCYIFSKSNLTFWKAENMCQNFGGHLASIHDTEEAMYIGVTGDNLNRNLWIGLYTDDLGQSWKWTDGTPFDFPNWIDHEPNFTSVKKCGAIFVKYGTYTGGYGTFKCDTLLHYVCKRSLI